MADNTPKSDQQNPPSVDPKTTNPSNPSPSGPDIRVGEGGGPVPGEAAGTEPSGNSAPSTVPTTASAEPKLESTKPKPTHPNPNYPDQQLPAAEIEAMEAQKSKTKVSER